MTRLAVALLLSCVTWIVVAQPADARAPCNTQANLRNARQTCEHAGAAALPAHVGATGPRVFLYPMCAVKVGPVCGRNLTCTTATGKPGVFYAVTVNGEPSGRRCIGDAEANGAGIVTPGQVLEAMRRLDWPASPLVIQPPDGLTLVNFETNFYTTGTSAVTRVVTLLGQRITIEATPSEYHWAFGDGESLASAEPGAAYPALTITHTYLRTGTYAASLDTTYSGRYRVGNGAWQDIPGTVTVQGAPESLRAIEAQPKLVGH